LKNNSFLEKIIANWPAKVLSIIAAITLFMAYRINTLEERFFSVPLQLEFNEQYIPSGNIPRNVRISLRGNRDEIFLILEEDIKAEVDLSAYQTEGQFRAPVKISKAGTALEVDPLEITVDPYEITVTLEEKISKTLEVFPNMEGFPAHGYELAQFFLNPTYIRVEGPKSKVQDMKTILTEEIDLSGKKENFAVRVRLDVDDPILQFPGGAVVEFNGIIQEAVILKTFESVEIIALDLEPELILTNADLSGSIRVQGSQLILEETRPEEIMLTIDCSEIRAPGIYAMPVKPDVPFGLLVLKYEPLEIELTIERSSLGEEEE